MAGVAALNLAARPGRPARAHEMLMTERKPIMSPFSSQTRDSLPTSTQHPPSATMWNMTTLDLRE
jgi:hypothetical protein